MKLLIVTQIVDSKDSNLGFFHRWIEEFSKYCEQVTVVCLKEGAHELPSNVTVLSLGKEKGTSKLTRIFRFFRYIKKYKDEYDAVFVHMNPEYVVLAGWLWRKWHKKVALWYAHRSDTWQLRKALAYLDIVFTVSKDSFAIATPKLNVVGHGIDTDLFKPDMHGHSTQMRLITTGRIAPSKHLLEMLSMLDVLHEQGRDFSFTIVGEAITVQDEVYKQKLQQEVQERPYASSVQFVGAVPHGALPALL